MLITITFSFNISAETYLTQKLQQYVICFLVIYLCYILEESNFTKLSQQVKDLGKEGMFPWGNESVKKTKSSHSISTVFYSHPESF
jgi:hypothetical protein